MNKELKRIINNNLEFIETNDVSTLTEKEIIEYNVNSVFKTSRLLDEIGVKHIIKTGWIIVGSKDIREFGYLYIVANIGKDEYYIDTMANIASNCKSCNGLSVSKKRQPWIYKKRHSSKTLTRFNNKQSK